MKTLVYCGAHAGNSLMNIAHSFDRVFAFEPNPTLAEQVRQRLLSHRNAELVEAAVASLEGEATLRLYGHDGGSSSLAVMNPEMRKTLDPHWAPGHLDEHGQVKVRTVYLPDFLRERGVEYIDSLVLDVQGYDLAVLRTMHEWLREARIGILQVEIDHDDVSHYKGAPPNGYTEMMRFMKDMPYRKTQGPDALWSFCAEQTQVDFVFQRAV
jgi:FkbM family methyltransferase